MKKTNLLFICLLSALFINCEDNRLQPQIPLRDYEEQRAADNDSIISFLQNHYYNYEEFESASTTTRVSLTIDSLINATDKIPLIDQVIEHEVQVNDGDDNFISHTMYIIPAREGVGGFPSIADEVYVTYKGMFLDGVVFDESESKIWFNGLSTVRGFFETYPFIKHGVWDVDPSTGLIQHDGFGTTIVIMPSALGYYGSTSAPRQYAPLIFAIDLYTFAVADHDEDSVPTIDEDVDGDGHFNGSNDDTDGDGVPNYVDNDDDDDGILTIDEYDVDLDGIPDDSDQDGIPDYLDAS
jgi:hypothetical protein